jgi:hypothetical protein
MTPDGKDVVVPTQQPIALMDLAVRLLFTQWPDATVLSGNGESRWSPNSFFQIPFGEEKELFVYPTAAASVKGEKDPTNVDLIHLVRGDAEVTVVMDPTSEAGRRLIDHLLATRFP